VRDEYKDEVLLTKIGGEARRGGRKESGLRLCGKAQVKKGEKKSLFRHMG